MNDLVWSLSHMLEDEMKGDQIVIYKISCQGCFLFFFSDAAKHSRGRNYTAGQVNQYYDYIKLYYAII